MTQTETQHKITAINTNTATTEKKDVKKKVKVWEELQCEKCGIRQQSAPSRRVDTTECQSLALIPAEIIFQQNVDRVTFTHKQHSYAHKTHTNTHTFSRTTLSVAMAAAGI